jgi:hypothetical protein
MQPVIGVLEALMAERKAVAVKESRLVATLNTALRQIGYQVVPVLDETRGQSSVRARDRRGSDTDTSKRARRRPMSAAQRKAVGRRMKAYWAKRRAEAKKAKQT